ncbi:MAG: hypothetical protein JXR37_09155 [Kiritimatiellae bacterium]|nr:hypothetical protein [Kiritimatiellia bacterium]
MSAHQLGQAKRWQREKALRLHHICRELREAEARGTALKTAVHTACSRHAGTVLDGGDGKMRTLPLSESTLLRHYYTWKRAGEDVGVFIPSYKGPQSKVPPELVREFHRRCTLPGMANVSVVIDWLHREWRQGMNLPGLGTWQEWWAENRPEWPLPSAAPDFPISRRTFYKLQPCRAERAMGNKGMAAARKELPWLERDTSRLRPGEVYVFDDVRLDILALDDYTKQPTELQAYIAYEVGCRYIPAILMRPANAMLARDVDMLVVRTLKALGIGRGYTTHLVFERGTVTMSMAAKETLEKASEGRIKVHFTGMNGGKRWTGAHRDVASGHWMGKAVLESFMRSLHLALMTLPGQRGNSYKNQPANLGWIGQGQLPAAESLAREAAMLAEVQMSFEKRVALRMPLLWASQVNLILRQAIKLHNESRGHQFQGFGMVTQRETAPGVWEDIA